MSPRHDSRLPGTGLSPEITRRSALRSLGTFALGLAAAGCLPQARTVQDSIPPRPLIPVDVAADRVIRTVVGLRPFRRTGFLIRADRFDEKTIVHNYGHGGCGVTLSWGSAQLAVEEAIQAGQNRYAVIGCGVIGLSTALLLQRRGAEVTIYAKDLPPRTTSNIAGATWYPSFIVDPQRRTPEFEAQYERAARLSHRAFQDLLGPRYGVRYIEQYWLGNEPHRWNREREIVADLFPETRELARGEHPFDSSWVARDVTMIIEPPTYLNALVQDFRLAGGRIAVRDLSSQEEILGLDERVILNCTGLGAKALFGDEDLLPIKGQLTVLLPQPEIDYVMAQEGLYMFPRTDGILLGGTFEGNVWDLEPNQEAAREVLAGHDRIFARMRRPRAA